MSTGDFRLASRLARREVRRRPGRTILVALLVAFPIAAMTISVVALRTGATSPIEEWRLEHGRADATSWDDVLLRDEAQLATKGPLGELVGRSRVARYRTASVLFRTADDDRSYALVSTLPIRDSITEGIMQITSGRGPARADEVFLTRNAADELRVGVGDRLELERPDTRSYTVVGVGERANSWGQREMVLGPKTGFPWKALPETFWTQDLIDFPDRNRPADIDALVPDDRGDFWLSVSPALLAEPQVPSDDEATGGVAWSWVVGAVVLTVVGIVIAAAFAMGARRQLVTLGQLAANGAAPSTLRRALFLQGTWTGLVGCALGIALAAALLAASAPHADFLLRKDVDPYTVRPTDLVPIVLLGLVSSTIAAFIPARTNSRVPVLAALAGRRPLGKVPRWLPVAGTVGVLAGLGLLGLAVLGAQGAESSGTVWALTAIVGGVAILLGACAIAPAYVSVLEPAAVRMHGAWRLATRSLARQRTRTGAVVSAVCATSALAVAASGALVSARADEGDNASWLRDDEVHVTTYTDDGLGLASPAPNAEQVAEVAAALPKSARRYDVALPSRQHAWSFEALRPDEPSALDPAEDPVPESTIGMRVGITTPELVRALELEAPDLDAFRRFGGVYFSGARGRASLRFYDGPPPLEQAPSRAVELAMVDRRQYPHGEMPNVLLTPAKARALDWVPGADGMTFFRLEAPLTDDQRNALRDLQYDGLTSENGVYHSINYDSPSTEIDPFLIDTLLVAVALLLVLFVVAVNLGLSAAETRDERDALAVVGASPATSRRTSGYKAALLTVMGTVLAVPVGFLPVAVFISANETDIPLVFPWRVVALLVIVLPIVAGLITTAGSATALRFRPVRVSTMAFD